MLSSRNEQKVEVVNIRGGIEGYFYESRPRNKRSRGRTLVAYSTRTLVCSDVCASNADLYLVHVHSSACVCIPRRAHVQQGLLYLVCVCLCLMPYFSNTISLYVERKVSAASV